ncbi:hypothetical protein ACOME3_005732 [Neoechinorhynchus agilis]
MEDGRAQDQSVYYYKNEQMDELDKTFGNIHDYISDRQLALFYKLELIFNPLILGAISSIVHKIGELDAYLALAYASVLNKWASVDFSDGTVDFNGSSASGKSALLMAIAQCIVLCQIGCCVPAKRVSMPIFRRIVFASANATIRSDKSAFMNELIQLSESVELPTQSMILIDDFGKGTLIHNAQTLLSAIVDHFFVNANCRRPYVVIGSRSSFLKNSIAIDRYSFQTSVHNEHKGQYYKLRCLLTHQASDEPTRFESIEQATGVCVPSRITSRAVRICTGMDLISLPSYANDYLQNISMQIFEVVKAHEMGTKSLIDLVSRSIQ